jgi:hypothetical protein
VVFKDNDDGDESCSLGRTSCANRAWTRVGHIGGSLWNRKKVEWIMPGME